MCQPPSHQSPSAVIACPTIKANARLRRSRRWKDQSENRSPNNDHRAINHADVATTTDNNIFSTPAKKKGAKNNNPRRSSKCTTHRKAGPEEPCNSTTDASFTDCCSQSTLSSSSSSDVVVAVTPFKTPVKTRRERSNSNASNSSSSFVGSCSSSSPNHGHTPNNNATNNSTRRKRPKQSSTTPSSRRCPKVVEVVPEPTHEEKARYIALDAEMVGIGPNGHTSRLARVSLVNWHGDVVYDAFVRVEEYVTDYRTHVSGITEEDLRSENAVEFDEARSKVRELIDGKILVGHGLKNDFRVLGISHPWQSIRDTAKYEPFMRAVDEADATPSYPAGTLVPKKLRVLAKDKLGMSIQEEGRPHSPVEDAAAALELYKKHREKWERAMRYKVERTREIVTSRMRSDSLSS